MIAFNRSPLCFHCQFSVHLAEVARPVEDRRERPGCELRDEQRLNFVAVIAFLLVAHLSP